MSHPEPIDLIEVSPGIYEPRLQHEVESLTREPPAPAKTYRWVPPTIVFCVSAVLGASFMEAVGLTLIVIYVHWVFRVVFRSVGLGR